MSIIRTIKEDEATGLVKQTYEDIKQNWGMIPAAITVLSASPELLSNQWQRYKYFYTQKGLSQKLLTLIRYLISGEAKCEYCIGFNGATLINMFELTQNELEGLVKDPSTAPLCEKEKALLLFVLKSVNNAHSVQKSDIDRLKKLGSSDKEIVDAVTEGVTMLAGTILFDTFKVEVDY